MLKAALEGILSRNWYLVFFIYGLAFFLMGFSIALQARRHSAFRLGQHLRLLAGFGLLHGAAEWAYIFLSSNLVAEGWETLRGAVLNGGHAILIATSFGFLLAFGGGLLTSTWGWSRGWQRVPFLLLGIWLWIFLSYRPSDPARAPEWLAFTEIIARYFLALPGALLSSLALNLQRSEIRGLSYPPLERSLGGASLAFALYSLAGGLVVPPAPFFPASFLNTSLLLKLGLPVQFLRAIAGVFMAYFIVRSLDLYEIESQRRLEDLRQRELIWLERERIRRDLHDGVIQAVYGLVLGLDHALTLVNKEPAACSAKLKSLRDRADALIAELRHYIQELHIPSDLPPKAVTILEDLLADFTATTHLRPDFRLRGLQEKDLAPKQREHFYHMAAEILSNVRRHAAASKVVIELDLGSAGVRLTIRDNGVGFVPERAISRGGMGLLNLRERAALAGGWVDIKSRPGEGTEVSVWVPYEATEGGEGRGH